MPEDSAPRIGVVLEAFTGRPLDDVLGWLRAAAPEVTDIEVGAGGYAPHPHRDVAGLAEFARAENPELLVCLEIHPGTSAFNVETFERVAALGPSIAANLDPSHFFWMGMDGHKVAARLGGLVGHAHGKDTVFHEESLALNGLLGRRWPNPAGQMPWTFAVPGRGHDLAWWAGLLRAMAGSRAQVQGGDVTKRLRVGVVGTGVIAQVMHLHYLDELADSYEVAAVCDIVGRSARACAERYGVAAAFTDWRDMLREPLDAVLVLTSGSHAPVAVAAARAGMHVLVEKPMCFSVAEGQAMLDAARQAGVTLMVAYPKRYDPAYARFQDEARKLAEPRLLRVTTFESPFQPYIGHYPLLPAARPPADVAEALRAETDASIAGALGADAGEFERRTYHMVLLDTLVHELNTVRGLLGEPDRLDYVDLREHSLTAMLRFGDLPVAIHWIDLPGIARYQMEFALFAPDARVRLAFPSPFLRSEPALLETEGGEPGTTRSWRTEETVSYESGFKRELAAFHECVISGAEPVTSGLDGLRDIALCQAIISSHRERRPVDHPTSVGAG
jgi:predicted dehydrogenase